MARLSREARRLQLIELGAEMITATSFDQFSVDDLAVRAGISRSLLFHYFDSRQDFLVAVVEHASQELMDAIRPDAEAPAPVQLLDGITGFLDHIEDKGDQYVSLVRGAAGGDARMQALFARTREEIAGWLVDGVAAVSASGISPLGILAAKGQIALAEEVTVGWLTMPEAERPPREQLVLFLATGIVDLLGRAGVELDPDLVAMVAGLTAASAN